MTDGETRPQRREPAENPRHADLKPARRARIPRWLRFRRTPRPVGIEVSSAAESPAALRAELVLLREENARLRAAERRGPDVRRALERALHVDDEDTERADLADGAAHTLVEALVLREALTEICQEIERSMVAVEAKLNALAPAPNRSGWLTVGSPLARGDGQHARSPRNGYESGAESNGRKIRLAPQPSDDETGPTSPDPTDPPGE